MGFTAVAQDITWDDVVEEPDFPPYVIVVAEGDEYTTYRLPDSLFNAIAGRTIFKVNRTELNLKDEFVHQLIDEVLPRAREKQWMLVGIDLRGAASPEGPYENNVRLSRGRTKALIDLMSQRLDSVQVTAANTATVAEDYAYLLWLLERDGDSAAPVVREIIEKYTLDNPAAIKAALQASYNGVIWKRLLADYFPKLRAARVVLFFQRIYPEMRHVDHSVAEIPQIEVLPPEGAAIIPYQFEHYTPPTHRQHMLAVESNLLYDAFYMPQYGWAPMPNVQLEFFPRSGNFTFLLGFMSPYYHKWSKNKFFQIRDYHLEVRRYFHPGERHLGAYLGLYANTNIYGIGLSATKGWQGEGLGGALKFGYVLPLGNGHWRMDMHLAVGAYYTRYDPYVYGNPITGDIDDKYYYDYTGKKGDFLRRNHKLTWLGPTEIGITITYDLLHWRQK